jgi:hypothetical protein
MPKMYNIIKNTTLDNSFEFSMSLRYGEPLDTKTIRRLKTYCKPTVEDFDDFVQEIWDFNYITGITDPIHVWVQHLKNQDTFMTFSSLNNGKFVPYFNKSLEVNLEFVEIAAENDGNSLK